MQGASSIEAPVADLHGIALSDHFAAPGGRYGGPLTHRSYTTPWGTTVQAGEIAMLED
jgi:hypothetical protein